MNRIGFGFAWPDLKLGKLLVQAFGQFLDAETFGRVMPRQHQGETVSLGGQVIMKAGFAGEQDIGLGSDGIYQELTAGAASNPTDAKFLNETISRFLASVK